MNAIFAGYVGKQFEGGFVGFVGDANLFLVLSIEEGTTPENGKALLDNLHQGLISSECSSLSQFESTVSSLIVKLNFPAHLNLAVALLHENILYIKTMGKGQIYYRRSQEFDLLMDGDKSASGYVQDYDCAVLTTTNIKQTIGQTDDLKVFVNMSPPKDIVEKLQNEQYGDEGTGFVALFAEFNSQSVPTVVETPVNDLSISPVVTSQPVVEPTVPSTPVTTVEPIIAPPVAVPTGILASKKLTIVAVILIFIVLTWSVVFGYQRREAALQQEKIDTAKERITTALTKAEEEAFLNFDEALVFIDEAKNELSVLQNEIGTKDPESIKELEDKIKQTESKIVKREEKDSEEFFDLALEDKNAQGDAAYIDKNTLAMLDAKNSTVYLLDLDKKSLESYVSAQVKDATLVATYNNSVFFFSPKGGVYKFSSESKAQVVIKPDSDWGKIVDIEIYNGNIYLLDQKNDEVYKYLVAEGGYSDKSSYFAKGSSVDVAESVGMAIDSALYIGKTDGVLKFLGGVADKFATDYPEKDPTIAGIYTNADLEEVYVWDTKAGVFYILGKDGKYNRQLASSIFHKAKSVAVYDSKALVFDGVKIYAIDLN